MTRVDPPHSHTYEDDIHTFVCRLHFVTINQVHVCGVMFLIYHDYHDHYYSTTPALS